MGTQHHVFGPAAAFTSAGQSAGTVAIFGVSTEGITIEIDHYVDPIMDDRAGPRISTDEQRFGSDGRVFGDFVWFDEAVRAGLNAWAENGTLSNDGTMGFAGALFGLGTLYYNLVIEGPAGNMTGSPTSETLWNFFFARLDPRNTVRLGTVKEIWHIEWVWRNYLGSATTLNNEVAYKRSFP